MKHAKKLLALLLTLALVLSLFAGLTLTAHADDMLFWYEELDDGTLSVYVNHETHLSDTSVTVPASIDGKRVTMISNSCFYDMANLTSVTISEGITTIDTAAFIGCSSLKSIKLPASVTNVTAQTFDMSSIEAIGVSSSSKTFASVDGVLFSKDKKTLIVYPSAKAGDRYRVPDGVTAIGESAFSGSALAQITLPDTLTSIESSAFYNCSNLTDLSIPDSVTSLGEGCFCWCDSLTQVKLPAKLTEIPDYAFSGCFNLKALTIPASVTTIGAGAFEACAGLKTLTIPDAVTTIGDNALNECFSLSRITLSKNVTQLGAGALCGPASIEISSDNPCFCTVGGIVFSKDQTVLVQYPGGNIAPSYTIPAVVTEIAAGAFQNASQLKHLTIPDSVTKLGDGAFSCSSLTELTIPGSITAIPDRAFEYCKSLTKIDLPDTVTALGTSAFICSGLTEFTVPDAVTEIPAEAFLGCEDLKKIDLPESITMIGESAFAYCASLRSFDIPYGVSTIYANTFSDCENLSSVSIPATVDFIWNYSFDNCTRLSKIVFGGSRNCWNAFYPEDGTHYGNELLDDATLECIGEEHSNDRFLCTCQPGHDELILYGITEKAKNSSVLTIPADIDGIPIRKINARAFSDCELLTAVRIPEGVEAIGPYAFSGCYSLNEVVLPSTLRTIGESAFSSCYSLQHIELPDGLASIDDGAFMFCYNLESIRIPEGMTRIDYDVFCECSSLREVELPDSLTEIGAYSFGDCFSLSSLEIPENVTSIEPYAFQSCSGLSSIRLPEGLTWLMDGAFDGCSALKWIYIPDSVQSIGWYVIENTDSLKDIYYEGSEAQWNGINIDPKNTKLNRIGIHYNSVPAVGEFLDVRAGDWFRDSVAYAYEKGLMNGTGDYIFSPNDSLTRAQLVTILYRMKGEPKVSFRGTFSDVAPGMWYSDAIEWAAANGIVNGYEDGTFKPNAKITREQIATILYRLEGSPETSGTLTFPDAGTVSGYAVDAMRWAVSEGLINGVASGGVTNLAPRNTATRAQIAAIIMRYLEGTAE